jgi:inorganic pyrophosphatase
MNKPKQELTSRIERIGAWSQTEGLVNVIVDTPKGSANKYQLDEELGIFKLGGVLTAGHSFPFDFGFIPGTLGGDGDPLDVLILMDESAFVGCLVECRLVGGMEAYQTEKGETESRNDRLLAVAKNSVVFSDVASIQDIAEKLVDQIEHFFVSYNEAKGKAFRVERRFGPRDAESIVREGMEASK